MATSPVFENKAYDSIFKALSCVQAQSETFANGIYAAASNGATDIALPGKVGADNATLTVDISTAAGAMAVSLWLEEKTNVVTSATQVAAEEKKETAKVNQTI